jgi:beta-aspartyl-peptidase (threonine type)
MLSKILLTAALILITLTHATGKEEKEMPAIQYRLLIHGGTVSEILPAEEEKGIRDALTEALLAGKKILSSGGKSLDAVEAVVRILEDSPWFNAGKGAVFTAEGTNELDASIMDGSNLKAGSVAGVKRIKNPISLARLVMEKSKHVMLAREGAEAFAKEQGIDFVDPKYFFTQKRWDALQREKKQQQQNKQHGTVGAVALDLSGNLAAATSTGGTTNKRFGRIGDSPLIGAGTYANNRTCAVSATGTGEYFIRLVAAHEVSAQMEYGGKSVVQAAETVVLKMLSDLGGDGGVIALDAKGNMATPFIGVDSVKRGYLNDAGEPIVFVYADR